MHFEAPTVARLRPTALPIDAAARNASGDRVAEAILHKPIL